ncbi:hypothetical protein BTAR23_AR23_01702 [Bacillus thuringiensis serovar israelensis]|uniref:Uncharacterized protein n=1 Tax=Bacillus thuringiensis subsp. israelensis TaxID=1430 RepID=A0AAX3HLP4_BACTI|nr:hypothetical protein BTAR23_AR23_01702 [Bacillus thuringiensis serovar israelensis]
MAAPPFDASYTRTMSPFFNFDTVIASAFPTLLFDTVIFSTAGATVVGSASYFTVTLLLSSLFGFVTVTYTVPPVDTSKSFPVIVASFLPSATAAEVAFKFPPVDASYIFTISPGANSLTVIVSASPALLFATFTVSTAGATVTSDSYFIAVRVLSNSLSLCTLTYTVPPVAFSKSFFVIVTSTLPSATASDVAIASPPLDASYTLTMSPFFNSDTVIVSVSPFLLFIIFAFSTESAAVFADVTSAATAVIDGYVAETSNAELTQTLAKNFEFLLFILIILPKIIFLLFYSL